MREKFAQFGGAPLGQPAHQLGEHPPRPDVRHMCPECGNPPKPFCPVCLGLGHIDETRLARWQREVMTGFQA